MSDTNPVNKPPVAVTLRRMAQTYKDLAEQAERGGRQMEAASLWRMHGELLEAANETEKKLAEQYGPVNQDTTETCSDDPIDFMEKIGD